MEYVYLKCVEEDCITLLNQCHIKMGWKRCDKCRQKKVLGPGVGYEPDPGPFKALGILKEKLPMEDSHGEPRRADRAGR